MASRRFFGLAKETSRWALPSLLPPFMAVVALLIMSRPAKAYADEIAWREWDEAVLQEAQKTGLLILVSATSKACPWCRKMEERTYPDRDLQETISSSFIPVRVNLRYRDKVPARFQNLVPPTTLVLAGRGNELFSHRGYLTADELSRALQDVLAQGRSIRPDSTVRESLPPFKKTLSTPSFDLQLMRAWQGEAGAREWLARTLDLLKERVDDDRGGVFSLQSGSSDEKLFSEQVFAARAFAQGSWAFGRSDLLPLGERTARYMLNSCIGKEKAGSAGGAGSSDPGALKDTAWAMGIMAMLSGITGEPELLDQAEKLRGSVVAGLASRQGSVSLDDTVACAEELANLYSITAERRTLEQAVESTRSAQRLLSKSGTSQSSLRERAAFARLAYLVGSYAGDLSLIREARRITDALAKSIKDDSADALVVESVMEARGEPLHIVVVGAKGDEGARVLWREAQGVAYPYLRREWWDRSEGALPNPDVKYPELSRPAAFLCARKSCSVPLFTPSELRERIREVLPTL